MIGNFLDSQPFLLYKHDLYYDFLQDLISSGSQLILSYFHPFRPNLLLKCAPQPKIAKENHASPILGD